MSAHIFLKRSAILNCVGGDSSMETKDKGNRRYVVDIPFIREEAVLAGPSSKTTNKPALWSNNQSPKCYE